MKIYHLADEYREGFLNEQGAILASWDLGDAWWRGEYMDKLMKALGIEVVYKATPEMMDIFNKAMAKYY